MLPAVRFENVTKSYRIGARRQFVKSALAQRLRRSEGSLFYALRGISFEIPHGASWAIIGPNGAGKSTLLSLMAKLSVPDEGTVEVDGRVAALLELGSGFHPDLTGVENIEVNAALLGLSRRQVRQRLEQIVDFAEIGEFIEEPLRTYSSGMMMRLAFSVAINVDADIVLIDEILTVGDAHFQAKCIDRIYELKSRGKTLVSVTHAESLLPKLCDRALLLEEGRLLAEGEVEEMADMYRARVEIK